MGAQDWRQVQAEVRALALLSQASGSELTRTRRVVNICRITKSSLLPTEADVSSLK